MHKLLGIFIGEEKGTSRGKCSNECWRKSVVECHHSLFADYFHAGPKEWIRNATHLKWEKGKQIKFIIHNSLSLNKKKIGLGLTCCRLFMTSAGKMVVQRVIPATPPETMVPNGPMSSLVCPLNASRIIYVSRCNDL